MCQLQSFNIRGKKGEDHTRLVLCDTMGMSEDGMTGLTLHDILSVVKGHVPEGHKVSMPCPVCSRFSAPPCLTHSQFVTLPHWPQMFSEA